MTQKLMEQLEMALSEGKSSFGDLSRLGSYRTGEVDPDGEYIDVDTDKIIGFYNEDSHLGIDRDEDIVNLNKLTKVWDKMFSDIDKSDVKGKTEDGRRYSIYASYDVSGIHYWLNDDYFNVRFTCRFDDVKSTPISSKDIKAIEKGFDKVIDKAENIIIKSIPKLNAQLKNGAFMDLMN